jgi:hypothetical protein
MEVDLDHVGVAVRDLSAARAAYARLGFLTTSISHHEGSPEPGKPSVPWGSSNHCAMLRNGYLELLGITKPSLFNPVEFMLAKYAGAHIVALTSRDADATYSEVAKRADFVTSPRDLSRMAFRGINDAEECRVAFKLVGFEREKLPEARFQFTQHLSHSDLWQPHLLDHPNGAESLLAVHIVSPDPRSSAANIARVLDTKPVVKAAGRTVRVNLDRSAIAYHSKESWEAFTGRPMDKPAPSVVGIEIAVKSIERTKEFLAAAKVGFINLDSPKVGSWIMIPEHLGCGAEIILRQ